MTAVDLTPPHGIVRPSGIARPHLTNVRRRPHRPYDWARDEAVQVSMPAVAWSFVSTVLASSPLAAAHDAGAEITAQVRHARQAHEMAERSAS